MSFAKTCKNELARLPIDQDCCMRSELAAFTHMNGSLNLSKEVHLSLTTENPAIARKMFKLFKTYFQKELKILMQKKIRLQKNNSYSLKLYGKKEVWSVLNKLGIIEEDFWINKGISDFLIRDRCCQRAYLRGAFLARGSVANPESSYHLELTGDYRAYMEDLVALLNEYQIYPGVVSKKKEYVLYLKDSEQICEFLNVIGAHKTLMDYENVRVMKGMRNKINRLVNCETANLQKTVIASLRHIENIKTIDEQLGLIKLPQSLQDIAVARVKYPEANMKELGEFLEPPVSKSGVNHRLRKIENIANKLRKGEPVKKLE